MIKKKVPDWLTLCNVKIDTIEARLSERELLNEFVQCLFIVVISLIGKTSIIFFGIVDFVIKIILNKFCFLIRIIIRLIEV